ncbi:adenosylcobinamide-GDP ribazoletransferase [Haloparvum sedimenti]|uniref:adenosylcobinamide-GDP ribazoletransferase n=1 Tax=Haloparvum sedimenti TaxID=1678448 RepID=UPI0009B5BA81|nr:adenosylcobinamide-GDP ribazoletransferase [Haloparvum sedimenti]
MSDADADAAAGPEGTPTPTGRAEPVPALRGAFGFLTRIPIPGSTPADWDAFRRSPWTFPVVGAVLGAVAGLTFALPVPAPTAVAAYLLALYLLGGITHADGLADLGDALAVHDPERRHSVLKDAETGVGGVLALGVTLAALTLGAAGLATTAAAAGVAFRIAIAAEAGAKLGMALLVCLGAPAHEGLGSQLVGVVGPLSAVPAVVVAAPVLLAPPTGALPALAAALLAGPAVALAVLARSERWVGGVSGDLIGAANELGRAVALHMGVVAWALT